MLRISQQRSVLAITDERAINRIYNVAESSGLSQAELISAIGQIVDWRGEVVIVSKAHLPPGSISLNTEQDWLTDSTRIREELGYTEPIGRDEAVFRDRAWGFDLMVQLSALRLLFTFHMFKLDLLNTLWKCSKIRVTPAC